ncbi:MAG: hypothetical protein JXB29_02000, partial [Sedimentisphaerales bacterium]|nr:hypothetical protein [Sedimentisphaerales bacterium]
MKKLLFIFISVLPVFACKADIIVVDANGTGDYPTIQAAINAANDFDVVELQPGTYTGDGNRDIDYLGKPITVRSINPNDPNIVAATVIDCNGMETELHRGFRFDSNEDGNSILMGLTIANGYGPEEQVLGLPSLLSVGGAIFCKASSPYIFNCVIKNNEAFYGGGMFNHENSKPKIVNCTFLNNRVPSNSRG